MSVRRVIPCLDVKDGRVVKGVQFTQFRDAGDPAELAAFYDREGADEIFLFDITASAEGRKTMVDVVKRTAERVSVPFGVGGGIRTPQEMRDLLNAGADKVSINSAAVRHPELINLGVEEFGSDRIVLAIDCKRRTKPDGSTWWEVVINGGHTSTGMDVVAWAQEAESRGAGELVLNSIDADGTKAGYDNELNRTIARRVSIPVVASGGAGTLDHLLDGIVVGEADAVLAASIFHFGEVRIAEVKAYLAAAGIPVRQ